MKSIRYINYESKRELIIAIINKVIVNKTGVHTAIAEDYAMFMYEWCKHLFVRWYIPSYNEVLGICEMLVSGKWNEFILPHHRNRDSRLTEMERFYTPGEIKLKSYFLEVDELIYYLYFHKLYINQWILEACFEEIYKEHVGNNRYLRPKEWFYRYLTHHGINANFTLMGCNKTNGNRSRKQNNQYIILDRFTRNKADKNRRNRLYVDDVFINTNWCVYNEGKYVTGRLGKDIHRVVMENKGIDVKGKYVHHYRNTFDCRFEAMGAMTDVEHGLEHGKERALNIIRCSEVEINTFSDLVGLLEIH